jgi:hypothetical protein
MLVSCDRDFVKPRTAGDQYRAIVELAFNKYMFILFNVFEDADSHAA